MRRKRESKMTADRSHEAEVVEEFEHHIAMRTQENVAAGMSLEEARADALRRFGDMAAHRRRTTALDGLIERRRRRTERVDLLSRSVGQAARSLAHQPGFALMALLTLALGIGATTAIYTVLDAVVLRPLPYPEPARGQARSVPSVARGLTGARPERRVSAARPRCRHRAGD